MPRGQIFRPTKSTVAQAPVFVAAATNYSLKPKKNAKRQNEGTREWQDAAWVFYDTVGEYHQAVSWIANQLSKALLRVKKNGEPTEDQPALDAVASLFGGPDGHAEMFRLMGIHFTVAGEGYVVGIPGEDEDEWMVAAATEVTQPRDGAPVKINGDTYNPHDIVCFRTWKPHPRKPKQSDSPTRAVLPILGELSGLTEYVAAEIDSRLTSAGMLLLPSEIDMPTTPVTVAGENPGDPNQTVTLSGAESVGRRLVDVASKAVGDRHSAAAKVPIVFTAPGEHLNKAELIQFWSGLDEHAKELREEAIHRLALGMDMPPEILTGTGEMNHWGANAAEEAAIKAHTEPLLAIILSSLTIGYLRPFLQSQGVADWAAYEFYADTSEMRLRPNRSKEAMELYDRAEVNGETVRRENGFTETDAMTPEELKSWYVKKVAQGQTTPEIVAQALILLGVPVQPAPEELVQVETHEARPTRSLEEHPTRPTVPENVEIDAIAAAAGPFTMSKLSRDILLGSEMMVHRALERAGNRLKNKVGTSTGVAAPQIYLAVPRIGKTEAEDLLVDAWSCLDTISYEGIERPLLEHALNTYTLTLIRLQKPHDRASLERHLALTLAKVS